MLRTNARHSRPAVPTTRESTAWHALALVGLLASGLAGCGRVPQEATDRPSDAAIQESRAAPVERVIDLRTEGEPIGLSASASVCDQWLFLADPRESTIHQFSLTDGVRWRALGGPAELRAPDSVAAACDQDALIVLAGTEMVVYRISSGEILSRTPRVPAAGRAVTGFSWKRSVVFSGLWVTDRTAFTTRAPNHVLDGFRLGYRVNSREAGTAIPLLDVVTPECRVVSAECLKVSVDAISPPTGGWVACQGGGSSLVGVYADTGQLVRHVDVRSPLFLSDGSVVAGTAPIEEKIQWQYRNSSLSYCAAFAGYIVSAHYTFEEADWQPGTALRSRAFLNIHRLDGTPIALDRRLRDRPTARSDETLYVVVSEEERPSNGGMRLELDAIRILNAAGALDPNFLPLNGSSQ